MAFFWLFCSAPKIKYMKYETARKQKLLYRSTIIISILLILCGIYLVLNFAFQEKKIISFGNLPLYIIIVLCILSMGIRSLILPKNEFRDELFIDSEKNNKVRKHYKTWGVLAIVMCSGLIVLMLLPL